MSITATASVDTTLKAAQNNGLTVPLLTPNYTFAPSAQSYAAGTAAAQVDVVHVSQQSVASGTPVSIDLSAGTIKDMLGTVSTFAKVATLGFYNRGAATVTLTGNFLTTNLGASVSIPLAPGGRFVFDNPSLAGLTVTNSTADVITLTSATGTCLVDVFVTGRSV